jgi:flagellar assembly factor FliW
MSDNTSAGAPFEVDTRFGPFVGAAADVVTLPDGVPGFERCRRFVLAALPGIAPFTCVQGLDEPRPSFLAIDPRLVVEGYAQPLSDADRGRLAAAAGDPLVWLSLVQIDGERATVNLRAPIIINPRRMVGLQMIPFESAYAIDHPLPLD